MKITNKLNHKDIQLIEAKIKEFETNTGSELLMVIANACDEYPGAVWRFSIVSSLSIAFIISFFFNFHFPYLWPVSIFFLIALMSWVAQIPQVKKLAFYQPEVDRECQEKAIELFHSAGTSQVDHKVTCMIMLSMLERKIIVLVDEKLKEKISHFEINQIIDSMREHFQNGQMSAGLLKSMETLEKKIIQSFSGKVSETPPEKLKNEILFYKT